GLALLVLPVFAFPVMRLAAAAPPHLLHLAVEHQGALGDLDLALRRAARSFSKLYRHLVTPMPPGSRGGFASSMPRSRTMRANDVRFSTSIRTSGRALMVSPIAYVRPCSARARRACCARSQASQAACNRCRW